MTQSRLGQRRLLTMALALAWATTGIQAVAARGSQTPAQGRLIAVLVDDLHIEFKLTPTVRTMMRVMSNALIREGDQFAIRSTGYSQIHVTRTSDRPRFAQAILKLQGAGLSDRDAAGGDSAVANSVKGRVATRAAAFLELLTDLGSITDRRKVLVCISPDPCAPQPTSASVVVYTVDPRRFATARAEFDGLISKINADIR